MPNNLVLPGAASSKSKSSSRTSSKSGSRVRAPTLPYFPALALFTVGKACRVFAAFVSFAFLQSGVSLFFYLTCVTFGASVCLLALQRPWNGKRIGAKRARRTLLAGLTSAITLTMWSAGLRAAGPLRALLVDGAELPLVYVFALVRRRELPERRKTRGAILMLIAYMLLMWDASGHVPNVQQLEQSALGQRAELTLDRFAHLTHLKEDATVADQNVDADGMASGARRRLQRLVQRFDVDQGAAKATDWRRSPTTWRCELGVMLVLAASVMMQSSRAFTRRLATELGGAKRYFALGTSAASAWLALATLLVSAVWNDGGRGAENIAESMRWTGVGVLWLVVPYYVRAIVSTAISTRVVLQGGVVLPFVMAVCGCAFVGATKCAGGASWLLVAAFLLNACGVSLMMAGGARRAISELPLDGGAGGGSSSGAESGAR